MKKLFSLLILACCINSIIAQPSTKAEIQAALADASFKQKFQTANDLFYQKKFFHAQQIFLNMLKEEPDNAHINYKTGICFLNSNTEKTQALPYLLKAEKQIGKNFDPLAYTEKNAPQEVLFYLAQAYHLDYQFDKSIEVLEGFMGRVSKKHMLHPMAELLVKQCNLAKKMVNNPDEQITITNLGPTINGPDGDFGPVITLDGNAMYFTSNRLRADSSNLDNYNWSNGKHFEDIYVSYKDKNGEWSTPKLIDFSEIDRNEATIGLSSDGLRLLVYLDETGKGDIYYSEYSDTAFEYLEMLGSDINSEAWETHATISPDGNTLYFVSDREGGLGGRDIYICRKLPNGRWGLAENLGAPINTEFDEDSPFLAPDGKTLYYSSNGPNSMGGFDIFVTQRNEENTGWVKPGNLGYPINTVDDDIFFIISADGVTGYYSSMRELLSKSGEHGTYSGYGEKDIYQVRFESEALDQLAVLKGYIVPKLGDPVPTDFQIFATDKTTGEKTGPYVPRKDDGGYALILTPCHSYHVEYIQGGKVFSETEFEVPCEADIQTINREIYLDPLALDSSKNEGKERVRWKVIDASKDLTGTNINFYDTNGKLSGSVQVGNLQNFICAKSDDGSYKFQFEGVSSVICKSVCVAQVDENDNILGYAVRYQDCFYEYNGAVKSWQLTDKDGNPIVGKDIRVVTKSEDGQEFYTDNVDCGGRFLFREMDSERNYLLEIETEESDLCADLQLILVDGDSKERIPQPKKSDCEFVYNVVGPPVDKDSAVYQVSTNTKEITFEKHYGYNKKGISASDPEFKAFIADLKQKVKDNGSVSIEISSSASKVPTTTFKSNERLAKSRASDAKAEIIRALKAEGVDISKVRFPAMTSLVLGPSYRNDYDSNKATYQKYQYVKVSAK